MLIEMDFQNSHSLLHMLPILALAIVAFAVGASSLSKLRYRYQLSRLPTLTGMGHGEKRRVAFLSSAKAMFNQGYYQFQDRVYRIGSEDGEEHVVIPPKFFAELRKLPDSVLSLSVSFGKGMESKYTDINTDTSSVAHSIKVDLTPALVRLNPVIYSESIRAVQEEMPPCEDWTAVPIHEKLVNMVSRISGRIFVGPELCHDPEYLDCATTYTIDMMEAQRAIKKLRPFSKPFFAPQLPEVKRLRERTKRAKQFMEPIILARLLNTEKNDEKWEKPDDLLQWFISRYSEQETWSVEKLVRFQLHVIFAATETTSSTVTQILYSLSATPEYIQPIREEIRAVLAQNDGQVTFKGLQEMIKLDSYMKEVLRFYPAAGMTSFTREVLQGFTLSNGQYIPAGTVLEFPTYEVYHDEANYPQNNKFDGFRHYNMRQRGGVKDYARSQFVAANEQNLGFGYGQHACPGRFFAANEIKMMIVRLILDYDIKNVAGELGMYPAIEIGRNIIPDPHKMLMFKKL